MRPSFKIVWIAVFVLLAGCQKTSPVERAVPSDAPSKESSPIVEKATYRIWTDSFKEETTEYAPSHIKFMEQLGEIKVNCPEEGCHPSVVLLFSSLQGRCQGTLISEDEVLTANHCIQQEDASAAERLYLSNIPKSCERLSLVLPGTTEYPQEIIGCRSVRGSRHGDFSIVKLRQKVNRPFLKMESETQSNIKTAIVINKVSDGIYEQKSLKCTQRSEANHFNALTARRALKDCEIIGGNSGGPILNENGALWGVISSTEYVGWWNQTEIAGNIACVEAFMRDPAEGLNACWNPVEDMNLYLEKHYDGLPERKENERYFADNRVFTLIGVIPNCVPELHGEPIYEYEGKSCEQITRYPGDNYDQMKTNVRNCADAKIIFEVRDDFGSYYLTNVWIRPSNRISGRIYFTYIKKCKE